MFGTRIIWNQNRKQIRNVGTWFSGLMLLVRRREKHKMSCYNDSTLGLWLNLKKLCKKVFYAEKHWRMTMFLTGYSMLPPCCQDRSGTLWWLYGLPCPLASRKHPSSDNNSVPDPETSCCHHAVMVSQEHHCGRSLYHRPHALFVAKPTASKHWRHSTEGEVTLFKLFNPFTRETWAWSTCCCVGWYCYLILVHCLLTAFEGLVHCLVINASQTMDGYAFSTTDYFTRSWKLNTFRRQQEYMSVLNAFHKV